MRWLTLGFLLVVTACKGGKSVGRDPVPAPDPLPVTDASFDEESPHAEAPMIALADSFAMVAQLRCANGRVPLPSDKKVERRVRIPAFNIQRSTVTCSQLGQCVRMGACEVHRGMSTCREGVAVVPLDVAIDFCRWKGGTLPTYAQWQRAVRGLNGAVYPVGSKEGARSECQRPSSTSDLMPRCVHESPDGVEFATSNGNEGEWTSDVDCVQSDTPSKFAPLEADLGGNELDHVSLFDDRAEFRCVVR